MKDQKMASWIRFLLISCGLALTIVLFVPMWRIDLVAPQYPEGLKLLIYPGKLAGNVDIINGLNHYIGMKTLHTSDFLEFTILPFIIGFFAAAFMLVAVLGRRKLLYFLLVLFIAFGILAMYDFWRWEYNYGHNLDPDAAIIVPGMAYQPPLVGFKQLLNFGAYSMPDIGGWIFVSAGMILLFCSIMAWRKISKKDQLNKRIPSVALIFLVLYFSSCSAGPQPLKTGIDNCSFCKMTVSDSRFGAELITKKGKIYKFDDPHCIVSFLESKEVTSTQIKDIYLSNFCSDHQLININKSLLLKSEDLRSPMGGNIAAFDSRDSLLKIQQRYPGVLVNWNELIKQ